MQVLTDTYGRILTQHDPDGDVRTAVVWVPGDSRIDWDDASDQELVTLLGKYGYNDALTIENNNVTINTNGETETLTWDSVAMDFTVDVDMFQNGTQNMYFRTVNDGTRDVTVLVDADGKAIHAQTLGIYTNVLFTVANNGTEIDTITEGSSISQEGIVNACGGSVNVTVLNAGESVFMLVKGTHIQYCNSDDSTTTPSVAEWAWLEIFADEDCSELPQGNPTTVYAKLKKLLTNNVTVPSDSGSALRIVMAQEPGDLNSIIWGSDWVYESEVNPNIGVLTLVTPNPNPISVDGIQTKFY